ncbi:MAG: hypothetical protein ABI689_04410 [Thermoanaerobaculia bacterium]
MIRSILSVIVGILAGRMTIWLLGIGIHQLYPPPAGLDLQDLEAFRQYVAGEPTGMMLAVLASWAGGAFVGGLVAAVLSESRRSWHSLAVGGIQTALAAAQFSMIPHPLWFSVLGLTIFLPLAGLAGLVVGREPDSA